MNEYDKQAQDFLTKYNIEFNYTCLGTSHHWGMTRYKYSIEFTRKDKKDNDKSLNITFWGSNADYTKGIKAITAYDVLSYLSGNDRFKTFNDIISEFGSDLTGIDANGLLEESRKMRKFFTAKMLEDLAEIQ